QRERWAWATSKISVAERCGAALKRTGKTNEHYRPDLKNARKKKYLGRRTRRPGDRRRVGHSSREQERAKFPQQRLSVRRAWRPPDLPAIISPKLAGGIGFSPGKWNY